MRMRNALLATFLLLGLLFSRQVLASPLTVLGSVTVTNADFSGSPTNLVGVVIIHNPGFEKTSAQQLPPFTAPVFVDVDKNAGQVVNSRFDTTLLLTNTVGATNSIGLILRNAAGDQLASTTMSLGAFATVSILLSSLLP